ncbi:MAG: hypothetical protein GY847_28015 [Proteobacteria bacterium]|nr:hypothetical protein [Pseudomonadota bacterium]
MDERARQIAHLFLREGSLRREDAEHQEVYAELMSNTYLYDDVKQRLAQVGYELVQELGHIGVRVASKGLIDAETRNRMQLHSGHIRMIVYLWVHLVYREWLNLRNQMDTAAPGSEQGDFFAEEDALHISYRAVLSEFSETVSKSYLKGVFSTLQRQRFIRVDEKRDRIWADSSLYVLVDRNRMEEFVIDIARRLGSTDPEDAISTVASGTAVSEEKDKDGSAA